MKEDIPVVADTFDSLGIATPVGLLRIEMDDRSSSSLTQSDLEEEGGYHSNPYGYLEENYSFGIKNKAGVYLPKSDFSIKLLYWPSHRICVLSNERIGSDNAVSTAHSTLCAGCSYICIYLHLRIKHAVQQILQLF